VYYLSHAGTEDDFYGVPFPAVGERVIFDVGRLLAARERVRGSADPHLLRGDEGLVVLENPLDVLNWPCQLWRVEDLKGVIRPWPTASYLWCQALVVHEELPSWHVMGSHGDAVVAIAERARLLTAEDVAAIAALPAAEEDESYRAVWQRWQAERQRSGSPVGCGLLMLRRAVQEAARTIDPGLFGWDEDDGVEVLADPAWQQASHAAAAAALADGAAEILGPGEYGRLIHRWVTGLDPRSG
jgi:hypothetical protein